MLKDGKSVNLNEHRIPKTDLKNTENSNALAPKDE